MRKRALACGAALAFAASAHAFKLELGFPGELVRAAGGREAAAFLRQFDSDVHERITRRAFERAGVPLDAAVIAGVRWNDNPPAMRLGPLGGACAAVDTREGARCWGSFLRVDRLAWEAMSRRQKAFAPFRSHFGDMQFLHAMGSGAGEPAAETRERMMRWSEFAWRVGRGEIAARARVHALREGGTALAPDAAHWVGGLFGARAQRAWTVREVFMPLPGPGLERVAFGSLLHLVQDSYSAAHVRRAGTRVQPNGCASYDALDAIVAFHTYGEQDAELHGVCDDAPDWLEQPRPGDPVELMAELVTLFHAGARWDEARPVLERAFALAADTAPASAGRCFAPPPGSAPGDASTPRTALLPGCGEAQ